MKTLFDPQLRLDLTKLLFLAVALVGMAAIFVVNPALSTPTLLSVVISMILSPWVAALERRGVSRGLAISLIFAGIAVCLGCVAYWAAASFEQEWIAFKEKAPEHFRAAIAGLRGLEQGAKAKYPFLDSVHPTDSLLRWGQSTGSWFAENGAAMVASVLTWVLIVPPLTFVMLNDGRTIKQRFFHLVPNRFFESFFLVSNEITTAISDYLRAKLVEAFLVGLMTTLGLVAVKAPYALVLGIAAGLTNIIPYLGPLIGAAPALLVAFFGDPAHALLWPVTLVYVVANVIDTVVIFPVVVAKLVKLHPLLLIAVVAIGQQYYGLIGMLISIPIATACKVIISEIHSAIYEKRSARRSPLAPLTEGMEGFEESA
jgi:putative permease